MYSRMMRNGLQSSGIHIDFSVLKGPQSLFQVYLQLSTTNVNVSLITLFIWVILKTKVWNYFQNTARNLVDESRGILQGKH